MFRRSLQRIVREPRLRAENNGDRGASFHVVLPRAGASS